MISHILPSWESAGKYLRVLITQVGSSPYGKVKACPEIHDFLIPVGKSHEKPQAKAVALFRVWVCGFKSGMAQQVAAVAFQVLCISRNAQPSGAYLSWADTGSHTHEWGSL